MAVILEDHQRIASEKTAKVQEMPSCLKDAKDAKYVFDGNKVELQRGAQMEFQHSGHLDDSDLKQMITKLRDENRRLQAMIPKVDLCVELETVTHMKSALEAQWQSEEEKTSTVTLKLDQSRADLQREQDRCARTQHELDIQIKYIEQLKEEARSQQEIIDQLRNKVVAAESALRKLHTEVANNSTAAEKRSLELQKDLAKKSEEMNAEKQRLESEFREVLAIQKKNFAEDFRAAENAHRKEIEEISERHDDFVAEELGKYDERSKAGFDTRRDMDAVVAKLHEETKKLAHAEACEAAIAEAWKIHEQGFNTTIAQLSAKEEALLEERRALCREVSSLQESQTLLQSKLESGRRKYEEEVTAGAARRRTLEELLKEDRVGRLRAEAQCKVQENQSSENMERLKWMAKYNESVTLRGREQEDWREKYQALKGQYEMLSKVYADTQLQVADAKDPSAAHLQRRVNELESERREMMLDTAAHLRKLTEPVVESPQPVRPPIESTVKTPRRNSTCEASTPATPLMSPTRPKENVFRSILKKCENDEIPIAEHLLEKQTPPPKAEVLRELQNTDCNQQ